MKKANAVRPTVAPAPVAGKEEKPAPRFVPRGARKDRLLVAIVDDRIDFSSMSPEVSKQLNELLHKPEVQAQFGIGPLVQKFNPEHCKRLYQAMGRVLGTGARFALHWPEQAARVLEFSEKEQSDLAGPTADVLNEYGNEFMQKNQSLLALGICLTAVLQAKISEASVIVRSMQAPRPAAGTVRPISSAPKPAVDESGIRPSVSGPGTA